MCDCCDERMREINRLRSVVREYAAEMNEVHSRTLADCTTYMQYVHDHDKALHQQASAAALSRKKVA